MYNPNASIQQIELRAYQLWEERGQPWGTPETDWFNAEAEVTSAGNGGVLTKVARELGTAVGAVVAFLGDPIEHEPS